MNLCSIFTAILSLFSANFTGLFGCYTMEWVQTGMQLYLAVVVQ